MGVHGCARLAKYLLVFFNFLVLCAGAIAIGLGAWGLASEYGAEKLKDLTGSELYRGAAIAVIVGGSILVVISFFGCVGGFLESRWLLGIYFIIMLLLLILFVTAAAVGFAYRDKIEDELNKQMEDSLLNKYYVNMDDSDENFAVTKVWDEIQEKLDCCGVSGGLNSTKSWFLWQSSQWFKDQGVFKTYYVPQSCCDSEQSNVSCQSVNLLNPKQPVQLSPNDVSEPNPALNHQGCIDSLEDKIYEHIIAIGGIAIAILIVMLVSIILAVCVCTNIRKSKMDDD